jgi:hypothetical protein
VRSWKPEKMSPLEENFLGPPKKKPTNKKQMLQISSRIFSQIFFRRLFLEFKIRFGEPRRKKNADDKKKKFKFNAVQFNREKYFTSKPPSCPWKQPQ